MREKATMGATVIGLGNPFRGDDGLGLVALARLSAEWELPPEVTLVDGGTWGMDLLPDIEAAHRLILVDALDVGANPGAAVVLERDRLPLLLAVRVSPHQLELRDVLALAEWRGQLPEQTVALGLQPGPAATSTELSPALACGVGRLIDVVIERLQSWGHACRRRVAASHA